MRSMCARWPYGGGWSRNIRSTFIMNGYPFLSRLIFIPFRLQPPHDHFPTLASARYCTQSRSSTSILRASPRDCRMAVAQKRVRDLRGFSPTGLAESSSLTLRTGISPQVALHLSSRKRSYHCRIQGGNVTLVGTCTQLIKRLRRRTRRHIPCAVASRFSNLLQNYFQGLYKLQADGTWNVPATLCLQSFRSNSMIHQIGTGNIHPVLNLWDCYRYNGELHQTGDQNVSGDQSYPLARIAPSNSDAD